MPSVAVSFEGVGVTLGLPFLDAMLPAATALAKAAVLTTRFGWSICRGFIMTDWKPETAGQFRVQADQQVARAPGSLTLWRDRFAAKRRIRRARDQPGELPEWRSSETDGGSDIWGGMIVDQIMAKKAGQNTLFLSLEPPSTLLAQSACETGYLSQNTLSWSSPTQPNRWNQSANRSSGSWRRRHTRRARPAARTTAASSIQRRKKRVALSNARRQGSGARRRLPENVREIERRLRRLKRRRAILTGMTMPPEFPKILVNTRLDG